MIVHDKKGEAVWTKKHRMQTKSVWGGLHFLNKSTK